MIVFMVDWSFLFTWMHIILLIKGAFHVDVCSLMSCLFTVLHWLACLARFVKPLRYWWNMGWSLAPDTWSWFGQCVSLPASLELSLQLCHSCVSPRALGSPSFGLPLWFYSMAPHNIGWYEIQLQGLLETYPRATHIIESLSMTFTADGKDDLWICVHLFKSLTKSYKNRKMSVLLFTTNTNIFILLFKELQTATVSFLPFDVTSSLISIENIFSTSASPPWTTN